MAPLFSRVSFNRGFGRKRSGKRKYPPFAVTGGTKTTSGLYTIHTFPSPSTLTITGAGEIEFLVVGGGGNGGNNWTWPMPSYCASPGQSCPPVGQTYSQGAGGGGAGGYRTNVGGTPFLVLTGSYPVIVGSGGQGAVNGASSIGFPSPIQASGGGNAMIHPIGQAGPEVPADPGGSGAGSGGRSYNNPTPAKAGGTGNYGNNDPRCNPSIEGYPGGIGDEPGGAGGFYYVGGSGGGAGGAGTNGGSAGRGISNSISGSPITYAAGGGITGGASGSPGTGSGGSGATTSGSGGSGAPGIVIIRYLTSSLGLELEL